MEKQTHSLDQLLKRIAVNPEVMVGKPVIRGTRIPVELIVKMMAQGISEKKFSKNIPGLSRRILKPH